jgi:flagellar motor component MotA
MKFSIFTLLSYLLSFSVLMIGSLDTVGAIGFSAALPEFLKIPFLDFPSLFVVLGGVMTGLFIMYPTPAVLNAVATLRHVFSHYEGKSDMVEEQISTILEYRSEYAADKKGFVERVK